MWSTLHLLSSDFVVKSFFLTSFVDRMLLDLIKMLWHDVFFSKIVGSNELFVRGDTDSN